MVNNKKINNSFFFIFANTLILTIACLNMCGRTGLTLDKNHVQSACSYKPKGGGNYFVKPDWLPEYNDGKDYEPSYNIAPTDVTPVLISNNGANVKNNQSRALKPMMWGIIPPWHKGDYKRHGLSTNNCRIENIKSSKLYQPILTNGGRCVVIAEGFYEWQTTIKSKIKQPYYIYAPQNKKIRIDEPSTWNNEFNESYGWNGVKLLHMAGLYNVWQNDETIIYSYSVITMNSNTTLDWLHHRMPAILDREEQIDAWLDTKNVNENMALGYLKPVDLLSWHQVSVEVNNSKNKTSQCNKRIVENKQKQKTLMSFFTQTPKRKSLEENTKDVKRIKM